jgi:hypothetical protein
MDRKEKMKILKVTMTQLYMIPMSDEKRTQINGWEIEEVIRDWFIRNPVSSSHATRDGHRIGYSEKVLDVSFIEAEDMKLLEKATEDGKSV